MVFKIFLTLYMVLPISYCSFLFNNITMVEQIAFDLGDNYCNCIVVQRSPNDTYEQNRFVDKLTESIAKGNDARTGKQLQTMSYLMKNYLKHYSGDFNLQSGNCFKWLNIVMVTEDTNSLLQKFSNPLIFRQAVWLFFTNGTSLDLFKNVYLRVDSAVWLIEAQSNNSAKITEVYNVIPNGKEIRAPIGLWTFENGLEFGLSSSKNVRRRDWSEATLRVGTYSVWPVTRIETNKETGKLIVDGYYPKVWQELQSMLSFSSHYVLSPDSSTGGRSKDGKWSGLLGMSIANQIDVILIELDYSANRLNIVEHLLPISKTNFQLFSRVEGYSFDWLAVFRPFYIDIWIALLVWVIVGALIMAVSSQITYYCGINSIKMSYVDAVFFILRTFSYQGSSKIPQVWTGRVLFIVCYMVASIILPSYSAALISSLAKRTPTRPFDSLSEALKSDYIILIPPKTSSYEYFAESNNPLFQKAINRNYGARLWLGSLAYYNQTIKFLCENAKTAIFTIEAPMLKSIRELPAKCPLQVLSQPVAQVYQSVAFPKNSPYRTTANYYILRMIETGMLHRFQQKYIRPRPLKPDKFTKPVDLADVSEIFVFLIFSYLLCGIILILEKQFFRSKFCL